MPAAIPIAAAVAGAAVSAYGSNKAANTQANAANAATAADDRRFEISRNDSLAQLAQQREDSAPYRAAGTASLAQLMAGTAPGGEFNTEFKRNEFTQDPGYAFRVSEGENGINRAATAAGARYSGATLKALARFNSGLASQEYGAWDQRQNTAQQLFEGTKTNKFNRLSSLAGIGQTANNALNVAGQQVNSNIAQLGNANSARTGQYTQDAAEARASGYVGIGNAVSKGISGLYNNYAENEALQKVGGTPLGGVPMADLRSGTYTDRNYLAS